MELTALKGVQDILPDEVHRWDFLEQLAQRLFPRYGYRRIIIPIIEESRLFTRSIGQETDIVEKEMYVFTDRGGRSIALRPEATASVVRAYLEHHFDQQGLVKVLLFRADVPRRKAASGPKPAVLSNRR
jgi:histidyl-tRNA synthetase (EC 6.1.1.21)